MKINIRKSTLRFYCASLSLVASMTACGTKPALITMPARHTGMTTAHQTQAEGDAEPTTPSTLFRSDTDCFAHEHPATRYRDTQSDRGEATTVEDALVTRRTDDALVFTLVIRVGDGVHCRFEGTALSTSATQYLYIDNAESGGACRLKLDASEAGVLVSEVGVEQDELSACVQHHCGANGPVTSGLPITFTRKPCMESQTGSLATVR